jgi:hypothetical protein
VGQGDREELLQFHLSKGWQMGEKHPPLRPTRPPSLRLRLCLALCGNAIVRNMARPTSEHTIPNEGIFPAAQQGFGAILMSWIGALPVFSCHQLGPLRTGYCALPYREPDCLSCASRCLLCGTVKYATLGRHSLAHHPAWERQCEAKQSSKPA